MASMRSENFWARVIELNLEDCIPEMKVKGLDTYAKFAFGSDYTPAQSDATMLTEKLLKPLAGANDALIPGLRMLWWESWGAATADMKRAAESSEGDAPRRLSAQEVETRRNIVTKRLVGTTITQELDVSDSLITACVSIHDGNRLKYVPWEQCTTRCMEVVGVKRDETFVRDPGTGYLKASEPGKQEKADLASDLKVDMSIRRRGLALEMADVMSWEKHERLREELMSAWARRPPPGYEPLSVSQVRKADEVAFTIMARLTSSGIKKVGGLRPMDAALEEALRHRDFNLALQPLPSGAKRSYEDDKKDGEDDEMTVRQKRKRSQAKRQAEAKAAAIAFLQDRQYPDPQGKAGGKGKNKGKDKGKSKGSSYLPPELKVDGARAKDDEGVPICFSFNLRGCEGAKPGGRCPKGRHVCILRRCQNAPHGYGVTHGTIRVE